MDKFYKYHKSSDTFTIGLKVKAASKSDLIEKFIFNEKIAVLKISTKTAPENGKANKAILKLIAKELKISLSHLAIIKGLKSSDKVLEVKNVTEDALKTIFSPYIAK